jgi:cell division septum initiation protein DivIVA
MAIYQEFWELEDMYSLARIYEQAKYDLHNMLRLYRVVKDLGMEKKDIINVLDLVKNDQLQLKAQHLREEINMLDTEKTEAKSQIFRLKRMIHEAQETLAQKRKEMACMNQEPGKYDKNGNL